MRTDEDHLEAPPVSARARMWLALVAWVIVGAATVGSLVYTSLERFTH
jgi:uncharacterized membrane protein